MVRAAKPKGRVLIWVYGRENNEWIVRFLNPLRKRVFSRLPIRLVHFLSLFPSVALWLALRMGLGKIEYFKLLKTFTFRHMRSIVFDQMLPQIACYLTKEEVKTLMGDAGLDRVKLTWVNEMSWSAVGYKKVPTSQKGTR